MVVVCECSDDSPEFSEVASECPAHVSELLLDLHFLLQAKEAEAPMIKKKRKPKTRQKIAQFSPVLFEFEESIFTPFSFSPAFGGGMLKAICVVT